MPTLAQIPPRWRCLYMSLGGPTWSFTVHGPEEFDKPQFIGLGEKIRHCSFVVAVSSYGRSQLYRWVEHQYWPKVQVVHCGLEAAYFAGPAIAVPAARRLVCVGRLCEQKGQLLLVEAAHRLMVRGVDFELVLAGDGEMRERYRSARYLLQPAGQGAHHWVDRQRASTRRNSSRAGACAAELRRGPSGGHHGGNGAEAAGHQHIRGRNSGAGTDG